MILLTREKTMIHHQLETLLPRLPTHHPFYEKVSTRFKQEAAGASGEASLDYYLRFLNSNLPLLHGLRVCDTTFNFQIDTLILFPSFILLIEVKNYAGNLIFHPASGLLTREIEGVIERFSDPTVQVNLQKLQLAQFLSERGVTALPLHSLVVFANSKALLDVQGTCADVILHEKLLDRIAELEMKYKGKAREIRELVQIGKLLAASHKPKQADVMTYYGLSLEDLVLGVRCSSCRSSIMNRTHGRWICPQCACSNPHAHISALQDWKVLFGERITARQACSFLGLGKLRTARRLLLAMCRAEGDRNSRYYRLP
ncbi:NERD domain-containing protein [Saliterribacillus persicus]|uniref:Nuclease-like protein n=1 Tax=Saliterribacillus persicus TaxID=930114 RepID=A0A368YGU7_9BACI|nr:NERD domain-containing protein [Saliterribacillus persicus]RCW77414.1 nuclease-like protein [Saliterribacillus persicus]